MASRKGTAKVKNRFLASLVTKDRIPCAFCKRDIDDELTYGKLYAIGDIQVHYFCVLLSCCLVQKGRDTEGLFGFLYTDILAELERSKKHKCSYCGQGGAALGCCVAQCRKQFHLPCGREKNAVSLYYGNYKSYCQLHAPKQKIPPHIMEVARLRMRNARSALKAPRNLASIKELCDNGHNTSVKSTEDPHPVESVCVICYEAVDGFPAVGTFWPPCCGRDAWFHRQCLQRMALSAGMHYLKCPLCNDKELFYDAVVSQGYYVPDRDAAWELEQNAFAEIYERGSACGAEACRCPRGRAHDADAGEWDIKLCILCGTSGCHAGCLPATSPTGNQEAGAGGNGPTNDYPGKGVGETGPSPVRYVCSVCAACAPDDLEALASKVEAVMAVEQQASQRAARRPIMPSRMSLRRTKARVAYHTPSTSRNDNNSNRVQETQNTEQKNTIAEARSELNLKPPRKPSSGSPKPPPLQAIENSMLSPIKLFHEKFNSKIQCMGVRDVDPNSIVLKFKDKLVKPRPLSAKKKIVDKVLEKLFEDIAQEKSQKQSPKKIKEEIIERSEQKTASQTTPEKLPNGSSILENILNGRISKYPAKKDEVLSVESDDDSSNSSFQLPPEFIADRNSDDDSLNVFETPKKLKTVDIEKDSSLEISENDKVVNINVVKMTENSNTDLLKGLTLKYPPKAEKCVLKFHSVDKEVLEDKVDIDLESFKNQYLNEIDKDFKCNYSHSYKHIDKVETPPKLRTAIDFALDAYNTNAQSNEVKKKKLKRKRQNQNGDDVPKKKKKKDKSALERKSNKNKKYVEDRESKKNDKIVLESDSKSAGYIKLVYTKEGLSRKSVDKIDLQVRPNSKNKKLKKKAKKQRDDIQVKIRFKEEKVRLEITKSEKLKKKKRKLERKIRETKQKMLSQYVLNVVDTGSLSTMPILAKPDHEITPRKRNYVKVVKSPDNLVQTSIQNFFKKM